MLDAEIKNVKIMENYTIIFIFLRKWCLQVKNVVNMKLNFSENRPERSENYANDIRDLTEVFYIIIYSTSYFCW